MGGLVISLIFLLFFLFMGVKQHLKASLDLCKCCTQALELQAVHPILQCSSQFEHVNSNWQ
jgi:hypothetical protein